MYDGILHFVWAHTEVSPAVFQNDRLIRDHGANLHEGDAYFGVPRAPSQEDAQADGQQTSSREGRG